MNIDTFFQVASPTTLASLIVDIRNVGDDASPALASLAALAEDELSANIGEDDAADLIATVERSI
jgi:hypothetical protein